MPPAVTQRSATDGVAGQPHSGEGPQHGGEQVVGRDGGTGHRVEQSAPGRPCGPNTSGRVASCVPRRRSSSTRPASPTNGLSGPTWKAAERLSASRRRERGCIDPQGIARDHSRTIHRRRRASRPPPALPSGSGPGRCRIRGIASRFRRRRPAARSPPPGRSSSELGPTYPYFVCAWITRLDGRCRLPRNDAIGCGRGWRAWGSGSA